MIAVAPASTAAATSVGVSAPSITGTPASRHTPTISGLIAGDTMNEAPASIADRACSGWSTVPAPTYARLEVAVRISDRTVGDRERDLYAAHSAFGECICQRNWIRNARRSYDRDDTIGTHDIEHIHVGGQAGKGDALRTTSFAASADGVVAAVTDRPAWQQFEVFDGKPLQGVRLFEIDEVLGAQFQMVEIAAGGHFAMHTSPDVAFCQIVRGRGRLGMPDDQEVEYRGPELYIFHPGSLHDWHDIEEDTLLSVCLIRQA